MLKSLKVILEIQELDMKMIRLMRLKKERISELKKITSIKDELQQQSLVKENDILEVKKEIRLGENDLEAIKEKIKELEEKQDAIKKVEEFNALNQEISRTERERLNKEQMLSDILDKVSAEEELLTSLKESLEKTQNSSQAIVEEIQQSVEKINEEGKELKEKRDSLAESADPDILPVYERLLNNKKDRVVVPIENRCCSGCHIVLTAQHENLVRKGERLVFCEHCSRIHYWQESEAIEETSVSVKRRRRRTTQV